MSRSVFWKITVPLAVLVLISIAIPGLFLAMDGPVSNAVAAIAWAVATAILLTIVASVLISSIITRPVRQITRAAEGIAAGKLGEQIPARADDEVGRLGRAFNEMSSSVKSMMAAIADERGRLVAVLSALSDGVVMTDSEGRIVLANLAAERLFSLKEAKVTGKPLIEAIPDHEIDGVVKKCLEIATEQTAQLDSIAGRFLRVIAVPIATSKLTGSLVLFQDLTEMRSLQTTRREFVGNVSHELRTPLAAIKAIVDTLRDGAINDRETAADFLNRLDVEVDGMTQMVAELMELSRIETGKTKLTLEPVDLNLLIEDATARLTPQADRRQVSLVMKLSPGLPSAPADRERIRHVIVNILHNAIKFTPPGGSIVVSTTQSSDSVIASISDTGPGISKNDLPHIFERFYKADKSRSSSGTGLGLAIAKHTLQAHGGSIWVESEEGKGATFSFSLPLRQTPRDSPQGT